MDNELLKRRLANARAEKESERVSRLIQNLRSGNVVTSETIALMERWGSVLETISRGDLSRDEAARLAQEALEQAS